MPFLEPGYGTDKAVAVDFQLTLVYSVVGRDAWLYLMHDTTRKHYLFCAFATGTIQGGHG